MIGVLAFQGDFLEHIQILQKLNEKTIKVKTEEDLNKVTHLIIPGGESTVIGRFLNQTALDKKIQKRVEAKTLAVYGTCAGAILLSKKVISPKRINNLNLISATLNRNAYGSQLDSFSQEMEFKPSKEKFTAVFIRAPKILKYQESSTKVLVSNNKNVFCLESGRVLISTFHPEVSGYLGIHRYFLQL